MNNFQKYTEELKNWERVSLVPVYLLASWLRERCIGWWKEAASLDKKCFTARFLFCLFLWRQLTTQRMVLHLLHQDSQMLFAQHHRYHIWKPRPEVSCTAPVRIPPFVAHEVCSKGLPSPSPSGHPLGNERKGRGGRREEGSCSEWCEMNRGEKVTHPKKAYAERTWLTNCHCRCPSLPSLSFVIHQKQREDSESYQGGIFHHKKLHSSN